MRVATVGSARLDRVNDGLVADERWPVVPMPRGVSTFEGETERAGSAVVVSQLVGAFVQKERHRREMTAGRGFHQRCPSRRRVDLEIGGATVEDQRAQDIVQPVTCRIDEGWAVGSRDALDVGFVIEKKDGLARGLAVSGDALQGVDPASIGIGTSGQQGVDGGRTRVGAGGGHAQGRESVLIHDVRMRTGLEQGVGDAKALVLGRLEKSGSTAAGSPTVGIGTQEQQGLDDSRVIGLCGPHEQGSAPERCVADGAPDRDEREDKGGRRPTTTFHPAPCKQGARHKRK
jgi:hypothetical protein